MDRLYVKIGKDYQKLGKLWTLKQSRNINIFFAHTSCKKLTCKDKKETYYSVNDK